MVDNATSHSRTITTKAGKVLKIWTVSQADYHEGTLGICLGCGEIAYGVEPDARKYECEVCGESRVYGLEEALIMGRVNVAAELD